MIVSSNSPINNEPNFFNPVSKIPKTCIKTSRERDSHK